MTTDDGPSERAPEATNDRSPFSAPPEWAGPSADPNDVQFGDAVERTAPDAADQFDVLIVGEPYDGAVIGRSGAAEGPAAIRESLAAAKTHHVGTGPVWAPDDADSRRRHGSTGPFERIGDLGDVRLPRGGGEEPPVGTVQDTVRTAAHEVHDADAFPVFIGGDNSLTFANVAPLVERGPVGVLSFDAHLDCRAVPDDVGPTSGTPYRQLFEAGLESLAVVGARNFETSTAYHDYLHERDGHVETPADVATNPVDALDDALASLGDVDDVYVSLDVDVLDASAAPGVSAPTPGGLSTRELFALLERAGAHGRVVGFEVVECAPPLDRDGRTVDAAARAVAHVLAGRARRRAEKADRVAGGEGGERR